MKRWPVFVIVAVVALGAGLGLAQVRSNMAAQVSGAGSQGTAPADDEFVARVLTSPFSPNGKEQGVRLLRGALPADPKIDAPTPQGGKLIGSVVRTSGGTPSNVQVILDAPGAPADLLSFYERELVSLGWKTGPDRGPGAPGGFQPAAPPAAKMFCKGDTAPWLSVVAYSREGAPTDVRLSYQLLNEYGGGSPCSQQSFGPQPYASRLPVLRPPSDVQVRGGGGMGSGPDRQTSETSAVTTRGAAELESHFAGQLTAAGWSRTGGSATGPVAWSAWKVPGAGEWTGLLLILETGSDRRLLSLRAESATAFR